MKRKYKIIILTIIIVLLTVSIFCVNDLFVSKTKINNNSVATLNYDFQDTNNLVYLTQEDKAQICRMFNDKDLFYDSGISCPFSDHLSISFGTGIYKDTFYPACDGCNTIKYKFKIFHLTEKEGEEFKDILEKYGVIFPCF